ncbi:hypothetical protein EDD92_2466 [Streptomyces sp. TLI_185]|nr:hypothetical protein EDD92_2466 [Streptomyces sp. TLI_185]
MSGCGKRLLASFAGDGGSLDSLAAGAGAPVGAGELRLCHVGLVSDRDLEAVRSVLAGL